MKVQLIMLDTPIIVSDETATSQDYGFNSKEVVLVDLWKNRNLPKVIASTDWDSFNLPSIDWNGLEEQFGWVDVEKLVEKDIQNVMSNYGKADGTRETSINYNKGHQDSWKKGFKKAQSLNEKKFSLEDMEKCFQVATNYGCWLQGGSYDNSDNIDWDDYKKTLQQPKVFDIEVEMEEATGLRQTPTGRANVPLGWYKPKITNNSIKIIKKL